MSLDGRDSAFVIGLLAIILRCYEVNVRQTTFVVPRVLVDGVCLA